MRRLAAFAFFLFALLPIPAMARADSNALVLLHEARDLAGVFGERIWPGMSGTPFPVLILYPHQDVLACAQYAPADFTPIAQAHPNSCHLWHRPAGSFPRSMQATLILPGFANPVMAIGTPRETGANAGSWVLTLLHEHFHQMQMSEPGYSKDAQELGLADGDASGAWMLDYPFPYADPHIARVLRQRAEMLAAILQQTNPVKRRAMAWQYARTRAHFMAKLEPKDRAYMELQLWQEGVARYTELQFAEYAAAAQSQGRRAPVDYAALEMNLRNNLLRELQTANPAKDKRDLFYPFGAAEALVLDIIHPDWRSQYFAHPFTLAPLFAVQD